MLMTTHHGGLRRPLSNGQPAIDDLQRQHIATDSTTECYYSVELASDQRRSASLRCGNSATFRPQPALAAAEE